MSNSNILGRKMKRLVDKIKRRVRRKYHVRKTVRGDAARPRLTVFRSLKHIYAQIIDDDTNNTIVSASTLDKNIREMIKKDTPKKKQSEIIGGEIAKRALEANIKEVAFDRNGFLYHGRVKALADGARKGGLKF